MERKARLTRVVDVVQWIVGVGAATAVVMLFTLDGAPDSITVEPPATDAAQGARIYAQRCATCHGAAGQGGLGPPLAGTVTVIYPDVADEVDVVANGRGGMPAFASTLELQEIAAVVAFTRDGLR